MLSQLYNSLNTFKNFRYFVNFKVFFPPYEIPHEASDLFPYPGGVLYLSWVLYLYFLEYPDYSFLLYILILVEHILQKFYAQDIKFWNLYLRDFLLTELIVWLGTEFQVGNTFPSNVGDTVPEFSDFQLKSIKPF